MNPLPSMTVIDFCEWLSNELKRTEDNLDLFDLLLDKNYRSYLLKFADDFLSIQEKVNAVKQMLRIYIDSNEFEQAIKELAQHYGGLSLADFICLDIFSYGVLWHSFNSFCKNNHYRLKRDDEIDEGIFPNVILEKRHLSPKKLASSAAELASTASYRNYSEPEDKIILRCMNKVNTNLNIEIEFLEWLIQVDGQPLDFRKMPLEVFKLLASKFQIECDKTDSEIRKLTSSFKQRDAPVLFEKLSNVLAPNTSKRAKELGYIVARYQDKRVRFKCFIVPLQTDKAQYKRLIKARWYDLHYLSGDYLDIYYSDVDYGRSGFEIMNSMSQLPPSLKTKAPAIILWEKGLADAQDIDITKLDDSDIFEVIRCIVNLIRENKDMHQIIMEARNMSKELREEHRAINRNTLTIGGNAVVQGPVAVINEHGKMISSVENNPRDTDANLLHDLEKAKSVIKNYPEIDSRQKQLLNEIIDEAKNAIRENSEEQKVHSKKRFKDAIDLTGIGVKIISALSGLATVLKFFGISPV